MPARSAQLQRAGGHGGSRVAGAHHGVGLALLHEVHGARDGGIALAAQGERGVVLHVHDLRGVDELDAAVVAADALQFRLDAGVVADQEEAVETVVFAQGQRGALDDVGRGEVAPHRINGDLHGVATRERRAAAPPGSSGLDGEDLPAEAPIELLDTAECRSSGTRCGRGWRTRRWGTCRGWDDARHWPRDGRGSDAWNSCAWELPW